MTEHAEQVAVIDWCNANEGRYPALRWIYSSLNGIFIPAPPKTRAKIINHMKAEGMKKGIPDLFLPAARHGYHGLFIEMKYGSNTPTIEQKDFMKFADGEGYLDAVCNGADEAIETLEWYMKGSTMDGYSVHKIEYKTAKPWILNRHYAKRMPPISHVFGLFENNILVGVVSYGIPASPYLCKGVCGDKWRKNVLELNRLVLLNNKKNEASYLIANTLSLLPQPSIIISYADTKMNHIGYVYQATNWLYTGCTKARTDMYSDSGHSRHNNGDPKIRQDRSAKHRYIFFVGNKRQVKEMRSSLNYLVLSYPKGDIVKYEVSYKDATQIIMTNL